MGERDEVKAEPAAGRPLARTGASGLFAGMRFPKLFVIVLLLFLIDLVLPDFIPFIDELLLGALAVMLGMVRAKARPGPVEESDP